MVIDNELYYNVSSKLKDVADNDEEYQKTLETATHWLCEKTGHNFTKDLLYPITSNGYIIDDTGEITTEWRHAEGVLLKNQEEDFGRV